MSSYPLPLEGNGFYPYSAGFDFNTVPNAVNDVGQSASGLFYDGSTYNLAERDLNHPTTSVSSPQAQMSPTTSVDSPQSQMSPDIGYDGLPETNPDRAWETNDRLLSIFQLLKDYPDIPRHPIPEEIIKKPKNLIEQRSLVRYLRQYGVSYEKIRAIGSLTVANSTMRYWNRGSKPKSERPRRPKWEKKDEFIMFQAVKLVENKLDIGPGDTGFYTRVSEAMPGLGASHAFSAQAIAAKYNRRNWGDVARDKKRAARGN